MPKILAVLLISVFYISNAKAEFDYADLAKNLQNCSPATYVIGPVDIFGMQITTKKQILGMNDGYCIYKEEVGPEDGKSIITCRLTQQHIEQLVYAAQDTSPTDEHIQVSFDEKGLEKVSGGNASSRLWTEYMNNLSICTTDE